MLRVVLISSLLLGAVLPTVAWAQSSSQPVEGRVLKVLPHLLDQQGQHTVSPSLFDRDAYQAYLRNYPEEVSGIRYDVLWKAKRGANQKLTVRIELRGMYDEQTPRTKTIETTLEGRDSIRRWTGLELSGEDYTRFGKITAWRATLWCNGEMLDEYKSFLW